MTTACVIGAGLSGLSAAWCLAGRGVEVEVVEAAAGPGGLIHTRVSPFGLIETAANAFVWTPTVQRWFDELQITPCFPLPSSRARYIWRGGRLRRWPLTITETAALGLRLAGATVMGTRTPRPSESVQRWGHRVVGAAATRWLLGPALHGIYAAAPDGLSAPLVIGERRRGRRQQAAPPGGMGQFIERLHDRLVKRGVSFTFGRSVTSIDPRVPTVIATGAPAAARLIAPLAPDLSVALASVETLPLATATAFFPPHPGDARGLGVLFPRGAGVRALGVLFNSDIFPGRSQVRSETWIYSGFEPGEDGSAAVAEDRRRLTGRSDEPLLVSVTAWAEAVPRYDEAILAVRRALQDRPLTNLAVTGNFVGQIGVAGLLESAVGAVRSLCSP